MVHSVRFELTPHRLRAEYATVKRQLWMDRKELSFTCHPRPYGGLEWHYRLAVLLRFIMFSFELKINLVLRKGIDPSSPPWKGSVLASKLPEYNLVLSTRIELVMAGYQPTVIPFNYKRIFGGKQRSRTPSHFWEPSFQGWSQDQPRCITFLNLEQRVRFELTVLRICNPLHWTSLPPLHCLVPA